MTPLSPRHSSWLGGGPRNLSACSCSLSFEDRQSQSSGPNLEERGWSRWLHSCQRRPERSAQEEATSLWQAATASSGSVGSPVVLGPRSKFRVWTVPGRVAGLPNPLEVRRAHVHLMSMFFPLVRMTVTFESFTMRKKKTSLKRKKKRESHCNCEL